MGIHSGACIGSVLGLKMPHFSVFGETVNSIILCLRLKEYHDHTYFNQNNNQISIAEYGIYHGVDFRAHEDSNFWSNSESLRRRQVPAA